jgi:hypothetical protein
MLQFKDQHGTEWDVFEVASATLSVGRPDLLPSAFRTGWLVFDCGSERRRLAPFPNEWSAFSTIALESLLDSAERVKHGPRAQPTLRTSEAKSPSGGA